MNGPSRTNEHNLKVQLAAQFNQFYLDITSPQVSQIGNYRIVKEIGEGAFGKVYLAQHVLLDVLVVLKCGLIDDPNIVKEIYYHRQLRHKNIVKLYEVIKTEKHLWLVMEYCEGNELFYYIYEQRRLNLDVCKKLFVQILNAIKYVHSLNLSHRDLKLENILLSDKSKTTVKLTDFGFVREFNPAKRQFLSTVCGTTVYMAPELLKNEKYSGFLIDIWSLGVIFFTMLYGEMPFDEDDDLKTKYKIIHEEPTYRDTIPAEGIALLKRMLCKDPYRRPTINEMLNSPFFNDINRLNPERSRRSSLYADTESIVSINQYYKTAPIPFQSKIERYLLKKLEKINVDTEKLQLLVINNDFNSLTAFYDLSLLLEFKRKKKRYLKERKLRYQEAKKSLKKSKNKMKSALSLSDQNNGLQPLERIISSLSLSSSRNVSGNGNIPLTNGTFSKQNDDSDATKMEPDLSKSGVSQRTVSFFTDDELRRPSNATTMSSTATENLKKRVKNNALINKLQFWKKNRADSDDATMVSSKSQESGDTEKPLEINIKHTPTHHPDTFSETPMLSPPSIAVRTDILEASKDVGEPSPEELKNGPSGEPVLDSEKTERTSLDSHQVHMTPTLDGYSLTSGYRQTRTRPLSMVSQMSQLSQLSQLSTMLSESELDILDETDTMDEDYDDDEAAYESSVSMSQDVLQNRHSSTGNGVSMKQRPSYGRTLSSDMSIKSSSSNTGQKQLVGMKRHSLSLVSSNSSDDNLMLMLNSSTPSKMVASPPASNDLDATLLPNKKGSVFAKMNDRKNTKQNKSFLINSKLWTGNSTNSDQSGQEIPRSHSPPSFARFNRLKPRGKKERNKSWEATKNSGNTDEFAWSTSHPSFQQTTRHHMTLRLEPKLVAEVEEEEE